MPKAKGQDSAVSERELLGGLRQGEARSVQAWYHQYAREIRRFVVGKIDAESDAEEIVQEVFINALKQLPLFQGQAKLKTWMLSIARHEVADFYRKKYAKRVLELVPLDVLSVEHRSSSDDKSTVEKVRSVLAQLPIEHQELLLLKYVDQKSVAEIAKYFRKSLKAIESELFRARRDFRSQYLAYVEVT